MARRRRFRKLKTNKKSFSLRLKASTVSSILQILLFATSALLIVSFSRNGQILILVNNFLTDVFGWTGSFIPFVLISIGFMISKFKTPIGQTNVIVGVLLLFLSQMVLFKAGLMGVISFDGMATLLTPVGTYISMVAMSIVGLIVMFNTPLDQVIGFLVKVFSVVKAYIVSNKKVSLDLKKLPIEKRDIKILGGNQENRSAQEIHPIKSSQPISSTEFTPVVNQPIMGEEKIWKFPGIDLLSDSDGGKAERGDIKSNADTIEQTLESFGIDAQVVEVNLGPAVTQYALQVAIGTKLSKITALERDMALRLAAPTGTIRIEAPIPGRALVGIELPNISPEFVTFRKMITDDSMRNSTSKLTVALGLDVAGKAIIANLSKMPHLLIAGQTGSGKSICINTFLCSLLYRCTPNEVKLILVDPKRVELTNYRDIPHLLAPVIVEPEKVISSLRWLIAEMERRYKLFAEAGVRNLDGYNEMSGFQSLPYIVLVIDEMADIMLFSHSEVEDCVVKLAQMSRATGIHMVLATQRPSVDVITGLIKANIPGRVAFAVSSQVDSRVILDGQGAEKLLGKGDMLYLPPEQAKPMRIQGAFISDKEVNAITSFIKDQATAVYTPEVVTTKPHGTFEAPGVEGNADSLYAQAVRIVCQYDKASSSLLQRRLSVGYARAARILDQLEQAGVVEKSDGSSKPRKVLISDPEAYLAGGNSSET